MSSGTPAIPDPAPGRPEVTQYAALCWRRRKAGVQVLLVTSRRTRRWVTPKGWPMDGCSPPAAAAVEAWEEAGVEGAVEARCIGIYTYDKILADGAALPCAVAVYPLKVEGLAKEWPERRERRRRWMSRGKASRAVDEPELARLIASFNPAAQDA